MSRHIQLYDTTLRDGTQREGISLSLDDKLKIAARLDAFGMDYIEGGWPGSNPKDVEFFRRAPGLHFSTRPHIWWPWCPARVPQRCPGTPSCWSPWSTGRSRSGPGDAQR